MTVFKHNVFTTASHTPK